MKFRPLGDRVVVRRVKEDTKTAGGIIIPETAQEKPQEGEVISVGPGALDDSGKRVAPEVKAGDFVLFGKWSGTEVKLDGEELLIMKESDIMGVLECRKKKQPPHGSTSSPRGFLYPHRELRRRMRNTNPNRIQEIRIW